MIKPTHKIKKGVSAKREVPVKEIVTKQESVTDEKTEMPVVNTVRPDKNNIVSGHIVDTDTTDNGNDNKSQISLQIGSAEWREMMLDNADYAAGAERTEKLREDEHEKIIERKVQRDTIKRADKDNARRALANAKKAEELRQLSDSHSSDIQKYYTNVNAYKRIIKLGMINEAKRLGEANIYLKYGRDGACKKQNKRDALLKRVARMGDDTLSSYTGIGKEDRAIENAYNNGITTDEYIPKTLKKYL